MLYQELMHGNKIQLDFDVGFGINSPAGGAGRLFCTISVITLS